MGILDEINKGSNIIEYKPITKEVIEQFMNDIASSIKRVPQQPRFIVGELMFIRIACIENNNELSKQINKLFTYLPYYNFVLDLYNIKGHHIAVGHSIMTMEERNIKNRYFMQRKEDIETKIKELYYERRK